MQKIEHQASASGTAPRVRRGALTAASGKAGPPGWPPDLLCALSPDLRMKRLNPGWTALLGWGMAELSERPLVHFIHPEDRRATLAQLSQARAGAVWFESRFRRINGDHCWLQWHAWPANSDGLLYASARDATRHILLQRELTEALDGQRASLGRELHDGLCQSLAGVAALSTVLSRALAGTDQAAAAAEIGALLKQAIAEARSVAHGLCPVARGDGGLPGELAALASATARMHGVRCELHSDGWPIWTNLAAAPHLLRIAQEAVRNAVAHGQASLVEIGLSVMPETRVGTLTVDDDGLGMPDKSARPPGLGLHSMAYRANAIGGRLLVSRRFPRGTTVTCSFPLLPAPGLTRSARLDVRHG